MLFLHYSRPERIGELYDNFLYASACQGRVAGTGGHPGADTFFGH